MNFTVCPAQRHWATIMQELSTCKGRDKYPAQPQRGFRGVLVGLQSQGEYRGSRCITWSRSSKCNPSSSSFFFLTRDLQPFNAEFTVRVPTIWCLKEIIEFHYSGNSECLSSHFYKLQASSFQCMNACSRSCDAVIRFISLYSALDSSILVCFPRKIKPNSTK